MAADPAVICLEFNELTPTLLDALSRKVISLISRNSEIVQLFKRRMLMQLESGSIPGFNG